MLPSHADMDSRAGPQQKQNNDSAISVAALVKPPSVVIPGPESHTLRPTKKRHNTSIPPEHAISLMSIGSFTESFPGDRSKQEGTYLAPSDHPQPDDAMIRTSVRLLDGEPTLRPSTVSIRSLSTSAATSLSPSPTFSAMSASSSPIHSTDLRGSLSPSYSFSGASPESTPNSAGPSTLGVIESDEDAEERERRQEAQAAVEQAGEGGSIVVDSDELDAGYESGSATLASTTLAESMRDYIFENGRRYHRFREGRYNFPNDDVEQQREDMKHAMVKLLCKNQLFFAPIGRNPRQILDIGTGTGVWAIEMGDLFDGASVLGVDLSPIQPEWLPPNVRFMVDDVESPWLHPRNHFDYIHSRHTVMAIKDWPRLMRRSLEHLRPGGWFELHEVYHCPISENGPLPPSHLVAQYWNLINEGLTKLGVQFHAVADGRMKTMMQECGYVNVQERVLRIPIGTWPKNRVLKAVGLHWRTILLEGIQAIALGPLIRGCGWSREQVELFLIQVRRAYLDNDCLAFMPLHIVFGQKPTTNC